MYASIHVSLSLSPSLYTHYMCTCNVHIIHACYARSACAHACVCIMHICIHIYIHIYIYASLSLSLSLPRSPALEALLLLLLACSSILLLMKRGVCCFTEHHGMPGIMAGTSLADSSLWQGIWSASSPSSNLFCDSMWGVLTKS